MSLPVILAVAVAAFLLAVMATRVWAHRSRATGGTGHRGRGPRPRVATQSERAVGHPPATARQIRPSRYVTVGSRGARAARSELKPADIRRAARTPGLTPRAVTRQVNAARSP